MDGRGQVAELEVREAVAIRAAAPFSGAITGFGHLRQTGEFVVVMDTLERGCIPMSLRSWKRMSNLPCQADWQAGSDRLPSREPVAILAR